MVQYLFDRNIISFVYAGLCGSGLAIRFILNLVYRHLVKESDNLGITKNKSLKHIRMKFETCYKLKIGVNNVDIFVDKNVSRYRFGGILLSTWENISGQVLLAVFLIIPVSTVFGVVFEIIQEQNLFTGAMGVLAGAVLILVDRMMNLGTVKQVIRLNLMDYLENFCKVRLEQETFYPEVLEQYRRDYFQASEANKQISAAAVQTKEDPKSELTRRKEARLKKEEERRVKALEREEGQKRIEKARKEEELRKMEERKRIAAKRREEELLKLEEEREALERRKTEMKKKAEEKLQANGKKQQLEEKEKLLHSIEEEFAAAKKIDNTDGMLKEIDEIAAGKSKVEKISPPKAANAKPKSRGMSPEEEKLIEDVLKEFFA